MVCDFGGVGRRSLSLTGLSLRRSREEAAIADVARCSFSSQMCRMAFTLPRAGLRLLAAPRGAGGC